MKTNLLKISLVSACLAFTMAYCSSSEKSDGTSDSDSLMNTESMGTDSLSTDTSGMGTTPDAGTATDSMGTGPGSGTESGTTNP